MTTYTTEVTQDARKALAEAIETVAETILVDAEYVLDPIEDARLIALIEEGNRLKREEGRLKRQREKINAEVREGIEATRHTTMVVDGSPVVVLETGIKKTEWDYERLERLAPKAVEKSRTVSFDGTRLSYK